LSHFSLLVIQLQAMVCRRGKWTRVRRVLLGGTGDSMPHGGLMSIAMPQKGNNTSINQAVDYGCIVEVNV